jgi:hypothetical protein
MYRAKLLILALFGLFAPLWWTMIVSKLIYWFYVIGGMPERPSLLFAWSNLTLPSIFLGLVTGLFILLLSKPEPILGWVVFFVFLVLDLLAYAFYFNSVEPFTNTFGSPSNLVFLVSTLLMPFWAFFQAKKPVGWVRRTK